MEPNTPTQPGTFIISLDLELYWGMFDKVTLEEYGDNIKGVHDVVPKLLELFTEFDIHATWATVGFLTYDNSDMLKAAVPRAALRPSYEDESLTAYLHMQSDTFKQSDTKFYFGPNIIRKIINTPGQELGSHTFAHYYALEKGQTAEQFAADAEQQKKALGRYGVTPRSLVFPRNQVSAEYLKIAHAHGISSYRGAAEHFLYSARDEYAQTRPWRRIGRLLDRYLPVSGSRSYVRKPRVHDVPQNLPASLQFLPYSQKLSFLESLKIRRIVQDIRRAAKRGETYHLWWHPHNFGVNQEQNLAQLRIILAEVRALREQYGLRSCTMSEAIE